MFVSKRRNLEPSGELAQFAVPCAELPEFLSGNRDHFTHWVQVLVLKRQGQLRLVRESREQFVAATAGNAANNPPDFEQVNRRIRQHLAPTGTGVVVTGTKPIGATSQAYFVEIHMAGTSNGQTVPIVTVMAVTVANQLPLAIQAYATPDAPDKPLGSIVGSYLRLILTQN